MSATRIVHLASLIRHQLMAYSGGNPRFITKRYHRLRLIHWGAIYPVFTNMAVIGLSYFQFSLPCNSYLLRTSHNLLPHRTDHSRLRFHRIYNNIHHLPL